MAEHAPRSEYREEREADKMQELRIVIADNESIIRMDLREMLEDAGHEIVGEASNG